MRQFFIFLLPIFLLPALVSAQSRKVAVYFGGGDKVDESKTQFFYQLGYFSDFEKKKGWESTYFHNGGHADDEAELRRVSRNKGKPFTSKHFENTLQEIENQILGKSPSGKKLKTGDQLMIYIGTHGRPPDTGACHKITTIDKAADTCRLKKIITMAEQKGIKLALIDDTCHSGRSIELARDAKNTCIIAGSGEGYAYGGDTNRFFNQASLSKNLEEAFLRGRTAKTDAVMTPGQPQISTPQGRWIFEKLRWAAKDLSGVEEPSSVLTKDACLLTNSSLEKLKLIKKQIDKELAISVESLPEWGKFSEAIKKSSQFQNSYYSKIKDLKKLDEEICVDKGTSDELCEKPSSINLSMSVLRELKNEAEASKKKFYVSHYSRRLIKYHQLTKSPHFAAYQKAVADIGPNQEERSKTLANEVSEVERKLYDKIYSKLSQQRSGSNPCKDFQL